MSHRVKRPSRCAHLAGALPVRRGPGSPATTHELWRRLAGGERHRLCLARGRADPRRGPERYRQRASSPSAWPDRAFWKNGPKLIRPTPNGPKDAGSS